MIAAMTFLLGCLVTAVVYRGAHEAWKEQFLEDVGPGRRAPHSAAPRRE